VITGARRQLRQRRRDHLFERLEVFPERLPRSAEMAVDVCRRRRKHEDIEPLRPETAEDSLHLLEHALGGGPLEPEQEIAGDIAKPDGAQIGKAALDGLDPLASAVVARIHLRIEGLDPKGELLKLMGFQDLQALAVHHRWIKLDLSPGSRMP